MVVIIIGVLVVLAALELAGVFQPFPEQVGRHRDRSSRPRMMGDLPVRGYDDPCFSVLQEHLPDHVIGRVPQPRVDDPYAACRKMLFAMAAGLPAVEHNGYVMSLQFLVGDELLYELLPFLPEIPVLYADEVIPVYDDSRNGNPPEKIWCYYSIVPVQKRPEKVPEVNIRLLL